MPSYTLQVAPRVYELTGVDANPLRNGNEVGLVGFEEADQGGEQCRFARPPAQLICPDTGQIEEALRPALLAERCRKCGER